MKRRAWLFLQLRRHLERSTLWMGVSVSVDWDGDVSSLGVFIYLNDPELLVTDSVEAYF